MNFTFRLFALSLATLLFTACQPDANQSRTNQPEDTTDMLQHTVYFYLNENVTSEEQEQFEAGLKKLLEIPEIYKAELGIPAATKDRDVTDHSFAYVIYTWFETMEDYQLYAEHPDHLDFIESYNHLWSDVKVYDADLLR